MRKVETRVLTASAVVTVKSAILVGASLKSAATDSATCKVYNGTSATNTNIVWETNNVYNENEAALSYSAFQAPWGKPCPNGIYVAITGTTPVVIVDFLYE